MLQSLKGHLVSTHLDKDEVLQRKKFYSPNEALKTGVPWETPRAAYDNKPTFFVLLEPFSRDYFPLTRCHQKVFLRLVSYTKETGVFDPFLGLFRPCVILRPP